MNNYYPQLDRRGNVIRMGSYVESESGHFGMVRGYKAEDGIFKYMFEHPCGTQYVQIPVLLTVLSNEEAMLELLENG